MHPVGRSLVALTLAGLVGLAPSAGTAQARRVLPSPGNVTVRVAMDAVHAPDVLRSGRYRLEVHPRRFPAFVQMIKPDRGYTRSDLRHDTHRLTGPGALAGLRHMMANVRFFGGAEVNPGRTGAYWETLYSGRYWLSALPFPLAFGPRMKTVHVHGVPRPSSFPRLTAHATGTDTGLRLEWAIAPVGRVLVRNLGHDIDSIILLPLRPGTTEADLVHWLRHPRGPAPVRFGGTVSTATVSPDAGYVLRYRLRPGRYTVLSLSSLLGGRGPRGLRQALQPLRVRRHPGARPTASATPHVEGFQAAPPLARRMQRWLHGADAKRRDIAGRLAATQIRRSVTRGTSPAR